MTAAEIARAFLITEPEVTQRIAAARQALAGVGFELPAGAELANRLSAVLGVIYLIFNEGYAATAGDELLRPELTLEALRLGRMLAVLAPDEPEVHGLVALMEIQQSRVAARTGPDGEPVQLHEQNRGLWDQLLIRRGFAAMLQARALGGPPGPYVLQAAIAVSHAQAQTPDQTDWPQIAALYDLLVRLLPTPVARLNRAVAVGMARGPQAGLDLTGELLTDPALRDYHLLPGVRGDLLLRLGRTAEAKHEFERAAGMAGNTVEREFLSRRAAAITKTKQAGPTLGERVDSFLARQELTSTTRAAYQKSLSRVCRSVGKTTPINAVTSDDIARVFATAWAGATANTWNRHLSAVRTFSAWAGMDLAAGVDRKPIKKTGQAVIEVGALLQDPEVPVRERTLWTLLHESAAQIGAVLAINVEDLDLADRRARTPTGWVGWRSRTAALLPDLVGERIRGPLFLTDRRPGPARPGHEQDRCPDTGRRRLSYERAEHLFKQASGGHTLRQLRSA